MYVSRPYKYSYQAVPGQGQGTTISQGGIGPGGGGGILDVINNGQHNIWWLLEYIRDIISCLGPCNTTVKKRLDTFANTQITTTEEISRARAIESTYQGGGISNIPGSSQVSTTPTRVSQAYYDRCKGLCKDYSNFDVKVDGSCSCRGIKRNTTNCPYSGCTGQTNASGCYTCRCKNLCSAQGYPGMDHIKADGSCYCKPKNAFRCNIAGCAGNNTFSSCYRCRCNLFCKGKGGVKTVRSDGSCYCNGVSSSSSSSSSQCPYSGCGNLSKGPGCFTCRCRGICTSKYPGTHWYIKADGSCYCR